MQSCTYTVVILVLPCRPVIYMQATSWVPPTEAGKDLHPWPDYPVEHLGIIQPWTLIGGDNYALLFYDAASSRGLDSRPPVRGFKINALFCYMNFCVFTLISSSILTETVGRGVLYIWLTDWAHVEVTSVQRVALAFNLSHHNPSARHSR